MAPRQIRQYCRLNEECLALLKSSVQELGLSARAHDKILRVARTIADLDAASDIQYGHLSEAINFRLLDRKFWT
jgi:magnesium chelatase family protein